MYSSWILLNVRWKHAHLMRGFSLIIMITNTFQQNLMIKACSPSYSSHDRSFLYRFDKHVPPQGDHRLIGAAFRTRVFADNDDHLWCSAYIACLSINIARENVDALSITGVYNTKMFRIDRSWSRKNLSISEYLRHSLFATWTLII